MFSLRLTKPKGLRLRTFQEAWPDLMRATLLDLCALIIERAPVDGMTRPVPVEVMAPGMHWIGFSIEPIPEPHTIRQLESLGRVAVMPFGDPETELEQRIMALEAWWTPRTLLMPFRSGGVIVRRLQSGEWEDVNALAMRAVGDMAGAPGDAVGRVMRGASAMPLDTELEAVFDLPWIETRRTLAMLEDARQVWPALIRAVVKSDGQRIFEGHLDTLTRTSRAPKVRLARRPVSWLREHKLFLEMAGT